MLHSSPDRPVKESACANRQKWDSGKQARDAEGEVTSAPGRHSDHEEPVEHRPRTEDKWGYRLKWGNFILTFLTLVVVGFYTGISYKQWVAADGQLTLLNKERRAWAILVTPLIEHTFEPGKKVRVIVFAKNSGRIPAHGGTAKITVAVYPWQVSRLPKTLHTDQAPDPYVVQQVDGLFIPPNDISIITTDLNPSEDILRDVLNGTRTLVMFGQISYTDDTGTKGDSGFCRAYHKDDKVFRLCATVPDWAK